MNRQKRHLATLDEVLIRRGDEHAWLIYKDHPFEATMSLPIGRTLTQTLTDQEILDRFNAHIKWGKEVVASERPLEIADGYPQLYWNETCQAWYAVGNVLRCEVGWDRDAGGPRGKVAIHIDDKLLPATEFLRILACYEGWGMRIEFVDPENLTRRPKPMVRTRKTARKQIPYPKFE